MKTPNSTYWKQRFEAVNEDILNRNAKEMEKHIYNSYTYALNNIEKDIENLISRISKNSGISYSDLKKNLNSKDLKSFRMTLEEYISVAQNKGLSDEWIKRLENASAVSRIDRLEMLKIQMSQQLEILAKNKNDIFNSNLSKVYSESYYHSIYELQKGFGYGNAFATLDTKTINEVLKKPWTSDLKTFSDRIWQDKETLINQLQTTFTQGIIRGAAPEKIIREIQKKTGSSYSATRRLVLTEGAAFSSIARCESYKELNVEKYSILATLDLKTSEICRSLDGKEFELSEYETGVTAPPFHPHCRTTTIPAFNDEFTEGEERFARDEKDNGYYVPSDMSFEEWKTKYVDSKVLTLDEERAIMKYISSESYVLNEKLRNNITLNEFEKELAENLDNALQKMPYYEGNLVRSVDISDDEGIKEYLSGFIVGENKKFEEFISTTKGAIYNEKAKIRIYIQDSSKGRDISTINVAEQEVLYERGSEFKVINKIYNNDKYYILLEEV